MAVRSIHQNKGGICQNVLAETTMFLRRITGRRFCLRKKAVIRE